MELKRESVYRHRSERLIDRVLLRVEKVTIHLILQKQVDELKEKLQAIEKRNPLKRRKLDTTDKQEEEKRRKEKYAGVDHLGALAKIMRHLLTAPAKYSKCLGLVYELVRDGFDFLTTFVEGEEVVSTGNVLFNAFDGVLRAGPKTREDRALVEKLYLLLVELSENEEALFSELQEKLLDLFYIPVFVQASLCTDDSFKFNEAVRDALDMLDSLDPVYSPKQDAHEALCTDPQALLDLCFKEPTRASVYAGVEDVEGLVAGVKRRLFFQTLTTIFAAHKHPWAKLTVAQTLKKVYLEK